MVLTPSNAVDAGTKAPDFDLPDPQGQRFTRQQVAGEQGLLVAFICNHCPFVVHLKSELAALAKRLQAQGIGVVAINANDVESYQQDRPELMQEDSVEFGYSFPYLFDETQTVAKAYDAACTPDFFLYDASLALVYHGQFDDSRPGNDLPVDGRDIEAAANNLLSGQPIASAKPSIGCNIKWRT